MIDRRILPFIEEDLAARKMVFIGGPRQVGKTTLCLELLGATNERHSGYLNWDDLQARPRLIRAELPARESRIVLDEIHKFVRWRGLVKGFYDTHKSSVSIIVTGSARLDFYRRGGDSLQGRYHYFRLHPLGLAEVGGSGAALTRLLRYGGFPEPYFHADVRFWRRWQRERLQRVLYEDLRDLERVQEITSVEMLVDALPARIGSPLSVKGLAEDLGVSFATADRWITILERLYYCFRILPFGAPKLRAVKKERKLYLWDWSLVEDPGARFENFVASQLLKWCHFLEDTEGHTMELRFVRDVDKREIDFVMLKDKKPMLAVECKVGDNADSGHAQYMRARTTIPLFYQVHLGQRDYGRAETGVRVLPFSKFSEELQLP